ncbi:hypothetical protein BGZ72_004090 [Mortierella alpina]|nr:hypothetical protein BGZ72_004090 [Mortierella alpina]
MAGPLVKGDGPLGPFGPLLGMGHRYAYMTAAIVMGSITLSSTIITFILARTHNDLKQRGRYLVFWNGLSATGIIVVYLMLNAFVGDFPCFVLLWTCYLCIVPWLLTYLARAWRLVYIYNQQVDFGKRTLQRSSAIELTDLRLSSNRDVSAGSRIDEGSGIGSGIGIGIGIETGGAVGARGDLEAGTGTARLIDGQELGTVQSGLDRDKSSRQHQYQHQQQHQQQEQQDAVSGSLSAATEDTATEAVAPAASSATAKAAAEPAGTRLPHVHVHAEETYTSESPPLPPLPFCAPNQPCVPCIHNVATPPRTPTPTSAAYDDHKLPARSIAAPIGIGILPDAQGVVLDTSQSHSNGHLSNRPWAESLDYLFGKRQSMAFDHVPEERGSSWSRFLPFNQATDGRLTAFLMACMIFPFVLCLGMQFVKPSHVQINPTSYKCGEGPVFYPIYAFMLGFLVVACPILCYKLRWVKDGFGIRNELLMAVCIGTPGFILYFISPFYLSKLDAGHWNHVNWLTLTIFFCHVNSVVLPLIQFLMRQRPKKRSSSVKSAGASGSRFANIFRWESGKTYPGTPPLDLGSDTSSFRGHSRASSQIISPTQLPLGQSDSSVYERQSIGQNSTGSMSDMPVNYSTATGHRIRGMKGFWARYGKDAQGNIIPLSEMNPRAFEYALHDPEMLAELVKFSVTVFSAENTKFLQEYEGLRKQVREYYRLVGSAGNLYSGPSSKHSRRLSVAADSTTTDNMEVFPMEARPAVPEVPSSIKPHKKKSSILGSVASSLKSKLSAHGSEGDGDGREGSAHGSGHGSVVGSIVDMNDSPAVGNGSSGSGLGIQPSSPHPMKSFGKPRQNMKGSLWRLSLQTSLRHSNPTSIAACGSVREEECNDNSDLRFGERRSHSAPSPALRPQSMAERYQHHQRITSLGGRTYHSDVAMNTLNDANDVKHGSGGNDSEHSSGSWYGRGNTGSALSYQDVTPSEISSYQDTASERVQFPSGYFGGIGHNFESMADLSHEEHHGAITAQESDDHFPDFQGDGDTRSLVGDSSPVPCRKPHSASSSLSYELHATGATSPAASKSSAEQRTQLSLSRQGTGHSTGSDGAGLLDGSAPSSSASHLHHLHQQRQPSRLSHQSVGNQSPFHSPSSSVSAPFTSRLPSQPQLHSSPSTTIRPVPPASQRTASTRAVLTAEEHRQICSSSTSTMPANLAYPADVSSSQQPDQQQHQEQQQQQQQQSEACPQYLNERQFSTPTLAVTQPQSQTQTLSRPELGRRGTSQMMIMPSYGRRTPVPRALQSAYWEISNTFIMPNSILELNLNEAHINEVKRLFANAECYLEMYEPIVKEVTELVYSNVWPRFVQSIQRHPSGLPGKFKRTWKAFFGKGPEDQGDEIYYQGSGIRGEGRPRGEDRSQDGGALPFSLQQRLGGYDLERPLPLPPPPQASYIHGRPSYLTGPNGVPGVIRLRGGSQDDMDYVCEQDIDVSHFGVMQELDLSALQRIVVDPK